MFCFSFLHLLLILKVTFFAFPVFLYTGDHHLIRSFACNSHLSVFIFKLFKARFSTSVKRNFYRLQVIFCKDQLATNRTLGFLSIHYHNTTKPAKLALRVKLMVIVTSQHFFIGDLLLTCNSKGATKAS